MREPVHVRHVALSQALGSKFKHTCQALGSKFKFTRLRFRCHLASVARDLENNKLAVGETNSTLLFFKQGMRDRSRAST